MMKKNFAMLSAAVLGCCMLTAPAFAADEAAPEAEQTYQLGDVDMDGEITAADAQLVMRGYVRCLAYLPCKLTEQQVQLSHVSGKEMQDCLYPHDALAILMYSVKKLAGFTDRELDTFFVDYANNWKEDYFHGLNVIY